MPTVADYLRNPPSLATLRQRWIIIPADLKARLDDYQRDETRHRIEPTLLVDGTYALCADVLTETGGIFAGLWSQIDKTAAAPLDIVTTAELPDFASPIG